MGSISGPKAQKTESRLKRVEFASGVVPHLGIPRFRRYIDLVKMKKELILLNPIKKALASLEKAIREGKAR